MGSSATAQWLGCCVCHFSGHTPSEREALRFVADEGEHPDNAVAAMLGGLTISGESAEGLTVVRGRLRPFEWRFVAQTRGSDRGCSRHLPKTIRMQMPSTMARALAYYSLACLRMTQERSVPASRIGSMSPTALEAIGPVEASIAAACDAGAVGGFISGSGSTLAAFVLDPDVDLAAVCAAMWPNRLYR